MPTIDEDKEPVGINIDPGKVCVIILKAREFDAKVDPVEPDPGSNEIDDDEREVLGDYSDDATLEELRGAINILDDDEVIDLVALAWVGRGDFDREEWPNARALARERHRRHSASYLLGMPALGDYLEEGLATLGYNCTDDEAQHL
jgi:hypothetical protein